MERKAALYASSSGKSRHAATPPTTSISRRSESNGADEEKMIRADEEKMIGADEEKMIGASSTANDEPFPSAPSTTHSRFPRDPWAYGDGRGTVDSGTESIGWSGRGHARGREDVERGIAAAAAAEAAAEAAKSAAAKSAAEATAAGSGRRGGRARRGGDAP